MVPIFAMFINIRYITYTTYFGKSPTVDIYIYSSYIVTIVYYCMLICSYYITLYHLYSLNHQLQE